MKPDFTCGMRGWVLLHVIGVVLLITSRVASADACYTWHIESQWLTADGTDPETLAYDANKAGYSGPDHPNQSLGPASCTITGDRSTGPAWANCTMTASCTWPTCTENRSWEVTSIVEWRATNTCSYSVDASGKKDEPLEFKSCVRDPIFPGSGAVYRREDDILPVAGGLGFSRFFNSGSPRKGIGRGAGWSHSFSRHIVGLNQPIRPEPYVPGDLRSSQYGSPAEACLLGFADIKDSVPEWAAGSASYSGGLCTVLLPLGTVGLGIVSSGSGQSLPAPVPVGYDLVLDDGQSISFRVIGANILAPPGVAIRLAHTATGFTVTHPDDSIETYDSFGKLLSVASRAGVTLTMGYDSSHHLSSVTDSFGHAITLQYDLVDRPIAVIDAGVRTIQYGYDSFGRLISMSNGDGTTRTYVYEAPSLPDALTGVVDEAGVRVSTWIYDAQGRGTGGYEAGGVNAASLVYNSDGSVAVTEPLGTAHTYTFTEFGDLSLLKGNSGPRCQGCSDVAAATYDAGGYPATEADYNGNVTTYAYDISRGLETSRTEASGTSLARTVGTVWDASFHLPQQITEPNRTTSYTYDSSGNALTRTVTDTTVTPNVSRTWTYTYDSYGRVLSEDGPRTDVNDTTTYTYYTCSSGAQCGQLQTVINALGQVTTFNTYNAFGQPLTITDANGVVATYTYDSRRRMTSWQVGNEVTTLSYWPTDLLKQVTLPDGSYARFTYDGAHRLTKVEDAFQNRIEYVLDASGNRTSESAYDPSGALARTQSRVFNTLGQLWKTVPSSGAAGTTTLAYDNEGNQRSIGAPLSRETVNEYDALNRVKKITDAALGTTLFAYDVDGNLSSVTDPRGLVTTYTYNGFGDQTQLVSPDTGTRHNTYDASGNLHTSTDARGIMGTYSYDALDRVTSISYPNQTVSFSYDSGPNDAGRLSGATDAHHSMAWSHDSLGRVTSMTQVVGGLTRVVGYSYSNGNLSSITTPSGQTVTYGYTAGRVSSIAVNGVPVLSGVLYDPFGPPRQWTWGNDTVAVRTYDADGKLTQLDSVGELHEYSYDDAMRITGLTNADDPGLSWSYGYDSLDRLTSETGAARTRLWDYDSNGDRSTESGSMDGLAFSGTYASAATSNRLSSITGARNNVYGYDAAGNVTSESNPGRPVAITAATTVAYLYNALGQRVWKSGPQEPTYFVYDLAGHLLGEYRAGGALVQETIWLEDIPVATLRSRAGGGVDAFYVHTDHLGTPRKVSRPADNALMWRWDSNAFGTSIANENPQGLGVFSYNLRFLGQYFDSESGLSYNYFRDYDPAIGRYLESDPIGLDGGVNTYAYVDGNPLSYSDPTGLAPPGRTHPGTGFPGLGVPGPYDEDWAKSRDATVLAVQEWLNRAVNTVKSWCSDDEDDGAMLAEQETLTAEEEAAVRARAAGKPFDKKVYNRARQKQIKNEKYNDVRNKGKPRGSG